MLPTAKDWLNSLQQEARNAQLDHMDVLINGCGLEHSTLASLSELAPAPAHAWLLQSTPEHEMAMQGPLLVRILLASEPQCAWLHGLLHTVHHQFRALALLSRWGFDDLAAHLRGATQATWSKGARSGLLRYYDTRLFRHFCELLDPHQLRHFHAPAIQWHWIDHDQRHSAMSGFDTRCADLPTPACTLSLSDEQVMHLQALSAAIQWFIGYDKTPHEHGLASREALIRCLLDIHRDMNRQGLAQQAHEAFITQALSEFTPLVLTFDKGVA